MQRTLIIFVGALVFILVSCSRMKVDVVTFPEDKKLYADTIPVSEIFLPDFVTKSGDNFIISSSKSDSTLFVYETPSMTFKSATGLKGHGPDEISTYPMFCHTSDEGYLYVRGYSHFTIRKIKLSEDGRFTFVDEYKLDEDDEYNFMNLIRDSLLVYYSSNKLAITKYDLKNRKKLDKIKFKKDGHGESSFYSNRGFISANDSFIVYPYLYKKQIDIYRVDDFQLVKRMGDVDRHPHVSLNHMEEITYHYFSVYAGKKYFYALYVGHKADENFMDRSLEVYDYAGNPIIRYTFDIVPFYFVVDEENGYIYATNSNYEDYLLRYKL